MSEIIQVIGVIRSELSGINILVLEIFIVGKKKNKFTIFSGLPYIKNKCVLLSKFVQKKYIWLGGGIELFFHNNSY